MNINTELIGKTIIDADVNGFGIVLTLDDGREFIYESSDGGYSLYCFEEQLKED